jgi:hypothetical protein
MVKAPLFGMWNRALKMWEILLACRTGDPEEVPDGLIRLASPPDGPPEKNNDANR